jgi:hypothetical protein
VRQHNPCLGHCPGQHKVLIRSTLQEIVRLLEKQDNLAEFFTKKILAAQIHKNPYFCLHGDHKY